MSYFSTVPALVSVLVVFSTSIVIFASCFREIWLSTGFVVLVLGRLVFWGSGLCFLPWNMFDLMRVSSLGFKDRTSISVLVLSSILARCIFVYR